MRGDRRPVVQFFLGIADRIAAPLGLGLASHGDDMVMNVGFGVDRSNTYT